LIGNRKRIIQTIIPAPFAIIVQFGSAESAWETESLATSAVRKIFIGAMRYKPAFVVDVAHLDNTKR
jgi:hypothetical protein